MKIRASPKNVTVNPDETLSFHPLDLPSWLSLDASGFLVGTPSDADIGQHEVSVQVTDFAGSLISKHLTLLLIIQMTSAIRGLSTKLLILGSNF